MKQYIINLLERWGVVIYDFDNDSTYSNLGNIIDSFDDVDQRSDEFKDIYKEVVEVNTRLKKLEEYLNIKYTVEEPKTPFIGYKKIK